MENMTKEELRNEITDLRQSVAMRDASLTAKDKENGYMRLCMASDETVFEKLRNEITELRYTVTSRDNLLAHWRTTRDEKDNEIAELHAGVEVYNDLCDDDDEKVNEIKVMNTAGIALRNDCSNLEADAAILNQRIVDKDNEIKDLRAANRECAVLLIEKDKDIWSWRGTRMEVRRLRNKIKQLRAQASIDSKVMSAQRNDIKELRQELATLRDYSDKQADVIRYYVNSNAELDKAAKNLQHFHGVDDE